MKKCSQCGKISDSNFCPECGGKMVEMSPATAIAIDEFSNDAESTAQSVDNGKRSESTEHQDKFFNNFNKKKVKDIIENMKKMIEDKKKRWILIGILMILFVIIVIGISRCGGNSIEGKWIEKESGEIVLELQDGKAYLYGENIRGQYEEDKTGIVITVENEFYRLSKDNIGKYTILVDLESNAHFYPSENYETILEIEEKENRKKLEKFKKELESAIVGDWRENNYDYEDLYRFTKDGEYQSTTIDVEYDWALSYNEGKYTIEYDEEEALVRLLIDGDSLFTINADEAEDAIHDLENGSWYGTDFSRETDIDDATKWLKEGKEDN